MTSLPVMETDRLRPFAEDLSDVPSLHAVLSDSTSMRFYPQPFDLDRTRAWIERWLRLYAERDLGLFAIEERESRKLVGDCGVAPMDVGDECFPELGWHVRRDRQLRGYATEAGVAWRDRAFAREDVPFLISLIRPENVPSWKVARKLGFRPWRGTVRAGMAHTVWRLDRPAEAIESGPD